MGCSEYFSFLFFSEMSVNICLANLGSHPFLCIKARAMAKAFSQISQVHFFRWVGLAEPLIQNQPGRVCSYYLGVKIDNSGSYTNHNTDPYSVVPPSISLIFSYSLSLFFPIGFFVWEQMEQSHVFGVSLFLSSSFHYWLVSTDFQLESVSYWIPLDLIFLH